MLKEAFFCFVVLNSRSCIPFLLCGLVVCFFFFGVGDGWGWGDMFFLFVVVLLSCHIFFFGDLFFGGENLRRVNFVQSKLVALRLDKYKSYRIGTKRGSYSKTNKKQQNN